MARICFPSPANGELGLEWTCLKVSQLVSCSSLSWQRALLLFAFTLQLLCWKWSSFLQASLLRTQHCSTAVLTRASAHFQKQRLKVKVSCTCTTIQSNRNARCDHAWRRTGVLRIQNVAEVSQGNKTLSWMIAAMIIGYCVSWQKSKRALPWLGGTDDYSNIGEIPI